MIRNREDIVQAKNYPFHPEGVAINLAEFIHSAGFLTILIKGGDQIVRNHLS